MGQPSRRPVGQCDPAELGVHQGIGGGPLPAYISRPHDELLRAVLSPATEYSRLVVVRGDALTGTSRSVYEAVTDVLGDWALEHPPIVAALADRLEAGIPARTVLWLGELRHYADADGGAAILDRLDGVLEDDGQVVAIATIWPGSWDSYAAAAAAGLGADDPAAAVGRLLAPLGVLAEYDPASLDPAYGGVVDVPARFDAEELAAAAGSGDPVLAAAAAAAGSDGQVTQHLAGAGDLLARYDGPGADPYGHALITAAMDASRLGHAGPFPAALLRDAAVGYLSDPHHVGEWDVAAHSSWALTPVPFASGNGTVGYRVVGFLDQHGRRTRADQLGPASLWDALTAHVGSLNDRGRLGQAAQDRGLYRHAANLWTSAVAAGRTDAAGHLITCLAALSEPVDAARWAVDRVSLDDPWDVARLLETLAGTGTGTGTGTGVAVRALLDRDPADQVSLRNTWEVMELCRALRAAGAADAARALVVRAAAQARRGDSRFLAWPLRALHEAGAVEALHALASRMAADANPGDSGDVTRLLDGLHAVGATDAIRVLAARAVEAVDVEDPYRVAALLNALRAAGADEAVRALLDRDPGRHASLDQTGSVADLLGELQAVGADDAVRVLAARAAPEVSLEDGEYAARLLNALRAAGADDAIEILLTRDPAGQANLMYPEDVVQLLEALHAVGAGNAVRALAARVVDQPPLVYYVLDTPLLMALRSAGAWDAVRAVSAQVAMQAPIENPEDVAGLLAELRDAGAAEAIQALLARDPAGQASLDDPWDVASLLEALDAAEADDAVRALADRAAGQASLDPTQAVARLLAALRKAGADDAIEILASRAAHGASLHDPQGAARLLEELCRTGAGDAVRTLLARDPGRQVVMDASRPFQPGGQRAVARLLAALREAGDTEAVRTLALRAADAGMFGLFLEVHPDEAAAYRFGREPDGTPSLPWSWSEPAPA
jgi:hypothetical protein